jgi:hypothetical protein
MAKSRKTFVEQRLEAGACLLKTMTGNPSDPVRWTFSNSNGCARADVVERLIADGRVKPMNDGLFEDSQSYALAR